MISRVIQIRHSAADPITRGKYAFLNSREGKWWGSIALQHTNKRKMERFLGCCDSRCCEGVTKCLEGNEGLTGMQLVQRRPECGVGVLFSANIEGALIIANVVKGGPADRSGLIKRGE